MKAVRVLETQYNNLDIKSIVNLILCNTKKVCNGAYVVFAPTYDCVLAKLREDVRVAHDKASIVCPDGMPIVWMMRALGVDQKERCSGPDVMQALLALDRIKEIGDRRLKHFFYGSTQETLDKLSNNLKQQFPNIEICGIYSPPFRASVVEEDMEIIDRINNSGADLVWVGLGGPKQQLWMYEHRDKIKPLMLGVGAAFDFFAQTQKRAPNWMQKSGLEWFFRLCCEPKRLFKRYFVYNSLYIYYCLKQLIFERKKDAFCG